jgi:hypothetical protein
VGKAERLAIRASAGGDQTLAYSATGLPDGLSIDRATGLISGTPMTAGGSAVTVSATDAGGGSARTTFRWTNGGLPAASSRSSAGLADGSASLSFRLTAGRDAPSIRAVVIALPRGVSFAGSARSRAKGITIRGPNGTRVRFATKLRHGALTIVTGSALSRLQLTIAAPAIRVSAALAVKIRHHRVKTLDVTITAVDASNQASTLALKFTV